MGVITDERWAEEKRRRLDAAAMWYEREVLSDDETGQEVALRELIAAARALLRQLQK